MFSLSSSHCFLLYSQPTDMRKSFDALCGIVRNELKRDPLCGEVFIFLNRGRTHIKLLHWESGGLVLYYKRLEKGTFAPPALRGNNQSLSYPQLVLMTEGIMIQKSTQKRRWCG
ncbi:MAG: transposase [Chitinophagaceae bacterium]|nr:MAG: transposase [Chitinophagaceae bacterium]